MEKYAVPIRLPSGEAVLVGPFHLRMSAQDFADQVDKVQTEHERMDELVRLDPPQRLLTRDALARELDLDPRLFKG